MRGVRGFGVALLWLSPFVHLARVEAQTCSNGLAGYEASDVCCPLSCGRCGGSGCSKLGEGCCTSDVKDSGDLCSVEKAAPCIIDDEADQTCSNGLAGYEASGVCCPLSCGQCGGSGCSQLGEGCCTSDVKDSGDLCSVEKAAPCIIDDDDESDDDGDQTCSNGLAGYEASGVCCPLSCGQCGGSGCSKLGEGCCTSDVKDSGDLCSVEKAAPCIIDDDDESDDDGGPTCSNGLAGYEASDVCCPLSCGQCGGSGCSKLGEGCCTSDVKDSGDLCSVEKAAPCIIDDDDETDDDGGPTCSNGLAGYEASDVCCPLSCGQCGGSGCSKLGEGCCTSDVKDSGDLCSVEKAAPCIIDDAAQTCPGGIEGINASDVVCCSLSCGQCAGAGCSSRPGGADACCGSGIKASGVYCDDSGSAPCIIGGRTTDACDPNPCLNGGSCALDPAGGHICTCSSDAYAGMHCQKETDGLSEYDLRVDYVGDWTDARRATFESAARRWEDVITHTPCGAGIHTVSATLEYIDGPFGILGSAGPRNTNFDCRSIATTGAMRFDIDDIDRMETQGTLFEDVILHEMGHTMGVGTLWQTSYAPCSTCRSDGSPAWTCPALLETYTDLLGDDASSTDVTDIVETDGASGTACGHLDENIFRNELMTGYISGFEDTPLSKLSAASLEDIGYLVDPSKVDPYALPSTGASPTPDEDVLQLSDIAIDTTIGLVDENGDVVEEMPGIVIETHFV